MPEPLKLQLNEAQIEIRARGQHVVGRHVIRERAVIGRLPDCDVQIGHDTVSRRHAEFFRDPFGRWWVRDLQSRYGVRVNGQRVRERVLAGLDEVQLGDFTIRLARPADRMDQGSFDQLTRVALDDAPDCTVSTLDDREGPSIAASHLTGLTDLGSRLIDTEDPAGRMRLLCDLLVSRSFVGQAALALRMDKSQPEESPRVMMRAQPLAGANGQAHISKTLLKKFWETRAPVLASNAPVGPVDAELSISFQALKIAALACPLYEDDDWLDLLYVVLPAQYGTREWLTLASLAATLFRQAETAWKSRKQAEVHVRIERELEQAHEIQRRLLPKQPSFAGLDVAIGFEPCRWVGGDYVDAVRAPDGRVLLTVADVCGKGLQAALVTGDLHAMVHSGMGGGRSLKELMRSLNEYLCEYLPEMSFVTMLAILLDAKSGDFEFANAGHPPAAIVGPGTALEELPRTRNVPLGLETMDFFCGAGHVERGQWMALYSDGLTDIADEKGDMLGQEGLIERLRQVGAKTNGGAAQHFARLLAQQLERYRGATLPQDDCTFLIAGRE